MTVGDGWVHLERGLGAPLLKTLRVAVMLLAFTVEGMDKSEE